MDHAGLKDAFVGSVLRVPLNFHAPLHAPEFPAGGHHSSKFRNFLQLYLFFLSFHLTETVSVCYRYMCAPCRGGSAKPPTETLSLIPQGWGTLGSEGTSLPDPCVI